MSLPQIFENAFGNVAIKQRNNVDVVEVLHVACSGAVCLHGGQVLSWQPSQQQDVFWLSKTSKYGNGQAIRGGVPICWPWFGPLERNNIVGGNHGFARQLAWSFSGSDITEKGVTIYLTLVGENQHKLMPQAYTLIQKLFFGKTFTQELSVENNSILPLSFQAALHSYFSVSSPKNTTINNLSSVSYFDKLTNENNVVSQLEHCNGPIDRVYNTNADMSIVDSAWQRNINVSSTGCQQWVLWNPNKEIANGMADIHENGEQEFICLEAANTNWVTIEPNQSYRVSQSINIT